MGYQKMGVPQNGWFIIFYTGESMNILHPDGCRGDDLGKPPLGSSSKFHRKPLRHATGEHQKLHSICGFQEAKHRGFHRNADANTLASHELLFFSLNQRICNKWHLENDMGLNFCWPHKKKIKTY